MRIMGICGSLRNAAFSLWALQALSAVSSPSLDLSIRRLSDVPMFSPEDHAERRFPPSAALLREQVVAADGFVISTPEYNHSFPGALKNALEWLHGKPGLLADKPVAIISTSPGPTGGIHAQRALRPILESLGANVLTQPELSISDVRNKFDADGALIDEATRKSLKAFTQAFEAFSLARR
jgi:chromate reductase, NAD(P)H dehydrogenase (quinone)